MYPWQHPSAVENFCTFLQEEVMKLASKGNKFNGWIPTQVKEFLIDYYWVGYIV